MSEIHRDLGTGKDASVAGVSDPDRPASTVPQDFVELLHQGYVCPPDSGPAWRAAFEAGVDMALIEDALRMRPADRLREHQRALNQVLALTRTRTSNDSGS